MMPEWAAVLAKTVFWLVGMTLVMRWLGRGRHVAVPGALKGRVQHHGGILAIGLIGTLFFSGVMAAASVWPDEGVNFWFYAFMGGMTLLSAYLVADYRFARHSLTEHGMDFGRPSGRRVRFGWAEVTRIRFSRTWNWFRIELRSGEVVRVSGLMTGLPDFAARILEQAPGEAVDGDTLRMLRDTAKGRLPPVWD